MSNRSEPIAELPGCGLVRTTVALPGAKQAVPAGALAYFHNHSDEGPPSVVTPASNQCNRWRFHQRGFLVRDIAYVSTLEPLKAEGFYRLREHFHPNEREVVNQNALVQLGYTRAAEPLVFFPRLHQTENSLVFPDRGTKIGPAIYALLEPLDHRGPYVPRVKHLH